jgi:hypothetical protein
MTARLSADGGNRPERFGIMFLAIPSALSRFLSRLPIRTTLRRPGPICIIPNRKVPRPGRGSRDCSS